MIDPLVQLARLFQEMRLARGWSCEELAERAGVPVETVRGYESDPASLSAAIGVQIFTAMPADPVDDFDDFTDSVGSVFEDDFDDPDGGGPPQFVLNQMEARGYELKAALRIDQRAFQEALELLDHALALHPGEDREGRLWLSRAAVLGELRKWEGVLMALAEAERCLKPEAKGRPWLCLRLLEIDSFCQAGRYDDARARWPETVDLLARFGSVRDRLRARCLEGWIAAGTAQPESALPLLQAAREELLADGQSFEATGLALDVAALLSGQGDHAGVVEISRQLEPLVRNKELSMEARSALKTFRWAVERGRFKPEMGRKMAIELRKAGCRLARPYDIPL
jgi:transcriptional regulator with XRE-family HTH domain